MEDDLRDTVVQKIQEMIPNVEILPFEIPQIRNKNKKDHEFITFHEEIKDAVEDSLIKKFNFGKLFSYSSILSPILFRHSLLPFPIPLNTLLTLFSRMLTKMT